ncbi:hypothetical protein GCM10011609_71340 [Lentzea pudingi]|uniref:ImpA N-terminal domain-containing protein n=1 Tax=Lentzea pudingi TaxID=1789439 RepID=A0ABQ2IQP3_9PSEU|nr:hypothetical protein [Lentzea pudingi]GGN19932.1 hypothetical protein GCM10011609_71340 [Lentzea pudingi]
MTTSSPESVSLPLYFGEVKTLAEMTEVLSELQLAYQECLQALNPPPDSQDGRPRILIRTGSLFVEFTAAAQSGAWTVAGLILLRALLTDTKPVVDLALLPGELIKQVGDQWHGMRMTWRERKLANRQFKIDEEARAAREAAEQDPAAGTLEFEPAVRPDPPQSSLPPATLDPPAQSSGLPSSSGGSISLTQQALSASAGRVDELLARTSGVQTDVSDLAGFVRAVLGDLPDTASVVEPLEAVRLGLEEVLGLLAASREHIVQYSDSL